MLAPQAVGMTDIFQMRQEPGLDAARGKKY
jgi:hypothetical protein